MGKQFSKLSDHSFKKGVLYTPFNSSLGDQLSSSPWAIEWLPEYLWLALILEHYGREDGLNLVGGIAGELSKNGSLVRCSESLRLGPRRLLTIRLFQRFFDDPQVIATSCDQVRFGLRSLIKRILAHRSRVRHINKALEIDLV